MDNQRMLDSPELARRLKSAMDTHIPRVTSVHLAEVCKVTPQAVNGWRKTGRIAKRHLSKIAVETGRPLEYFLEAIPGGLPALRLAPDEWALIEAYRKATPSHRLVAQNYLRATPEQRDMLSEEIVTKIFKNHVPDERLGKEWSHQDVEK